MTSASVWKNSYKNLSILTFFFHVCYSYLWESHSFQGNPWEKSWLTWFKLLIQKRQLSAWGCKSPMEYHILFLWGCFLRHFVFSFPSVIWMIVQITVNLFWDCWASWEKTASVTVEELLVQRISLRKPRTFLTNKSMVLI